MGLPLAFAELLRVSGFELGRGCGSVIYAHEDLAFLAWVEPDAGSVVLCRKFWLSSSVLQFLTCAIFDSRCLVLLSPTKDGSKVCNNRCSSRALVSRHGTVWGCRR